jgi:hypothetical protein
LRFRWIISGFRESPLSLNVLKNSLVQSGQSQRIAPFAALLSRCLSASGTLNRRKPSPRWLLLLISTRTFSPAITTFEAKPPSRFPHIAITSPDDASRCQDTFLAEEDPRKKVVRDALDFWASVEGRECEPGNSQGFGVAGCAVFVAAMGRPMTTCPSALRC